MFPFWIAKRDGSVVVAPHDSRYVAAFTSLTLARAFMQQAGESGWQFRVIGRAALRRMVEELRRGSFVGICLDPSGKGDGEQLSFAELE